MRCKMKAMITDMCILSHKTQCFLLLGHVVDVGAGKLRCFTVLLLAIYNIVINSSFGVMITDTVGKTYQPNSVMRWDRDIW